jgi:hypothetical protein
MELNNEEMINESFLVAQYKLKIYLIVTELHSDDIVKICSFNKNYPTAKLQFLQNKYVPKFMKVASSTEQYRELLL